ncbi:catalase-like [Brevipalpus obovatus]|uniref:catalase-like n=1 Tax=Brevipalpus obovatus TaxID=246614 RepID=UPI003D9FAF9E
MRISILIILLVYMSPMVPSEEGKTNDTENKKSGEKEEIKEMILLGNSDDDDDDDGNIMPSTSPKRPLVTYGNLTAMEDRYHPLLDEDVIVKNIDVSSKYYNRNGGGVVWDKLNILTAGKKGPLMMEDSLFLEEVNHFVRERISERVVHAKGAGAFGYFESSNHHITAYTKAGLFSKPGKRTKIAVRFSTVVGGAGSADTVRDPRGFAIKFYTDEGNFDMMMLNFPVFFVRDPLRFLNMIHSQKKDPKSNLFNYDSFWDFLSLLPETLHAVSYLFTDLGTPDGYRHMHGFSVNTFKLVNQLEKVVFARFHVLTDQGIRNLTIDKATRLAGLNPDYAAEDLYKAIKSKKYPSWTIHFQIMTQKQAKKWKHNPFDTTKLWPLKYFPLVEVGRIVLTHNPKNFFADIEQLAFNPTNLVSGIESTTDKVLQGRLFAYNDAQTYRLGTNFYRMPVNQPFVSVVQSNVRDGAFCFDSNGGAGPNYYPNSFDNKKEDVTQRSSKWKLPSLVEVKRYDTTQDDNYSQVTKFWDNLPPADQDHLVYNMAIHLSKAKSFIQDRFLHHVKIAHHEYYRRLKETLDFVKGHELNSILIS